MIQDGGSNHIQVEHQKIEVKDLVIMMIDDVGTGANLRILVVPLEGIDERITDRDSRIGATGTSNDFRAASVIVDDNSRRLLLIAKLLREWFVDEIDGCNCGVVAILEGNHLNDLVRVVNITILGPGGVQCVLA